MLVRTTLVALNQANHSGDYGVLHKISGPGLRAKLTVDQLAAAFANIRGQGMDLSPVVVITPQLDEAPAIVGDGVLRLVGFFPTTPVQIKFQMLFQPAGGQWRLLGMDVSAVRLRTPEAAAAAAAADKEKAPPKKGEPKKAPDKK